MEESIKDFFAKAYPDRKLTYFVSNDDYVYRYDETLKSIRFHYHDLFYNSNHREVFESKEEAMEYVKKNKKYLGFFHIDVKTEFPKDAMPKSFITHGENNYIGKLLTKKEVEALQDDPATSFLCLRLRTLDSVIKRSSNPEYVPDVETYVQSFSDGQVYPVFKYEKVLDKDLNQIYPVNDMVVEKLKGESR
ncbi:hypothetical protein HDR60_02310 [bacterium]|nr:hypothetical protein [bacterium]